MSVFAGRAGRSFHLFFLHLRLRLYLTQQEFADVLGINISNINHYEHGINTPKAETVELLGALFNEALERERKGKPWPLDGILKFVRNQRCHQKKEPQQEIRLYVNSSVNSPTGPPSPPAV